MNAVNETSKCGWCGIPINVACFRIVDDQPMHPGCAHTAQTIDQLEKRIADLEEQAQDHNTAIVRLTREVF